MLIRFGTTTKEINSTHIPGGLSHQLDVQIKDGCSMLSPVILLRDEVYNPAWNYCYIPKWNRYYFLHDAVIANGIWSVQCAVDVLASWRDGILSSTAYVSRSASDYSLHLEDSTWSHTDEPTITSQIIDCGMNTEGTFLLFTVSDSQIEDTRHYEGIPGVNVYKMPGVKLRSICDYMFSPEFFEKSTSEIKDDTSKGMVQTFFNPFQYVVKCMWLPFAQADIPGSDIDHVTFGWWDSEIIAALVDGHTYEYTFTFIQGTHTNWTDRNAAWTHSTLYVPGFGQFDLSTDFQGKPLYCKIVCDLATGQAGLFIKDSSGALLQSATGQLGADVQLSSLYEDYVSDLGSKQGLIQAGARAAGGFLSSLVGGGAIGMNALKKYAAGVAMAYDRSGIALQEYNKIDLSENKGALAEKMVNGIQSSLQPTVTQIGANGTRAINESENQAILTITKYARYFDVTSRLGGVCNKVRSLSGLSGYTEVVNPHVNVGASSEEITMINNFLSGGFYIE